MESREDLLEATQPDLDAMAEELADLGGVDRRAFLFMTITAAAATTFAAPALPAQLRGAGRGAATGSALRAQPPVAPYPLGNAEPPAEQFMPYPGGTGSLMEKLVQEHGVAVFERAPFSPTPWPGAVPATDEEIAFLPAHRLSALIQARKLTSVRLTEIYLDRLERLNPTLLFAVTIMRPQALAEAARADQEIAAGRYRGPLHGLPYGLKDVFAVKGAPTTWGSADFERRVIDEDAAVAVRLREAGAVLLAKLTTGLFAQGDQWFGGRTNNPWNLSQGSSGSSAGPASATAAGCVAFAIGTETQGSIVSPALRCGVSALRPTFGRVSRTGAMVLGWSHDRVGPFARTIEDCAMVFHAIHGADPEDPSTVTTPFAFDRDVKLDSLRVGVDPNAPAEFVARLRELGMRPTEIGPRPTVAGLIPALNVEYAAAFDSYVQRKAKEIGLDLDTVLTLPTNGQPYPGTLGAPATAGTPMARSDWNPRFVAGRTVKAFEYLQSQRRRYVLIQRWAEFMSELDMFIGAPSADVSANAQTGHPCVVVPYKFDVPPAPGERANAPDTQALNAQPIGAVVVGALYADDAILSLAHQFQVNDDTYLRHPVL